LVHYEDDVNLIPEAMRVAESTLVVLTPAIPSNHKEWAWFREQGFTIEKRSQMLGVLSEGKCVMAVAGTHGKTTTSTLASWLNHAVAEDHQTMNAMALVQKGAAEMVRDSEAVQRGMAEAVALAGDAERLERLSANIASLAISDAADRVVAEVEKVLNKGL
jgi:hypothetical protein